jgi:poly(ADP-ribose) glycohydrolase
VILTYNKRECKLYIFFGKALVGFCPFSSESTIGGDYLDGVATGNWGCGAFKGDPRLKFLIQLMAVSEADRKRMHYYTYNDETLAMDLRAMHKLLVDKRIRVGEPNLPFSFA